MEYFIPKCAEFNKCCFCIELRTGCLIIAYLNVIANFIMIVMTILVIIAAGAFTTESQDEELQTIGVTILSVMSVLLALYILFLIFSIILLVGLHQYKRGYVKAYLIYATVFIVLDIILFFNIFTDVGMSFNDLICIILNIYFVLVIRSYYLKMGDSATQGRGQPMAEGQESHQPAQGTAS